MMTAELALESVLKAKDINTILDVGSGAGDHAKRFREAGKEVTTLSLEPPADIIGDFADLPEDKIYDCVWAAHVLEHQLNPNLFLKKCFRLLKDDGLFAVTVPPAKSEIVGGHINLYNGGILLYQCILAGFDCSKASIIKYRYNISVIVRKKEAKLPILRMDIGDIEALSQFFPFPVQHGFNGNVG